MSRADARYWANREQLDASLAARARPEAQFDADSFFAVLAGFAQRGGPPPTAPLNVPTLVLFGVHDRVTPVEQQRRAIEAMIPGACIRVLDGCSHYVHLDRPRLVVDLVIEWASAHAA